MFVTYPDYIRQKAIRLRVEKKLTIDEISARLAISRTTAFSWVGRIEIPETKRQSERRLRASRANSRRAKRKRDAAYRQGMGEYEELAKDPTFRDFVCMYIGEGYKRNRNKVSLCNSDPTVVKLGHEWIVRFASNPVRYSIQHHADQDLGELSAFWGDYLGIRPDAVRFQRKSNSGRLAGRS